MTTYVDSSIVARRFLGDEPGHDAAVSAIRQASTLVTSRITPIEVRRALRVSATPGAAAEGISQFNEMITFMQMVTVDDGICSLADHVAEATGVRSLDAIHIASALRLGDSGVRLLTCDRRQADAASAMGIESVVV